MMSKVKPKLSQHQWIIMVILGVVLVIFAGDAAAKKKKNTWGKIADTLSNIGGTRPQDKGTQQPKLGTSTTTPTEAGNLGAVATTITGSFPNLTRLITATAYILGMGFALGAIMKFKAHKDNPMQEPIGKPVGLLLVAVALLFLPTILSMTGKTAFGTVEKGLSATGVSGF